MALANPVRGAQAYVFVPAQRAFLRLVPDLRVPAGQQIRPLAFIKLMAIVLSIGTALLLFINIMLTQDAFTLSQLERQAAEVSAQEEAITQEAARISSPTILAQRATQLGMKTGEAPAFIDLGSETILGAPDMNVKK